MSYLEYPLGTVAAVLLIVANVLIYRYAYTVARFKEQVDAIGSKRSASEVEPAEWNVTLTKGTAVFGVLFSIYLLLQITVWTV